MHAYGPDRREVSDSFHVDEYPFTSRTPKGGGGATKVRIFTETRGTQADKLLHHGTATRRERIDEEDTDTWASQAASSAISPLQSLGRYTKPLPTAEIISRRPRLERPSGSASSTFSLTLRVLSEEQDPISSGSTSRALLLS